MANQFSIPELNPIRFYDVARANLPAYFTKHFGSFPFKERLYFWQQQDDYIQIWQTTDIIYLQFESSFDPIVVNLLDENGAVVQAFPALNKIPNKYQAGTYVYEVAINLGEFNAGLYYVQILLGSGAQQKILISGVQYVSADQLQNTLLLNYWNSRYHNDVIFETGIQFQFRVTGMFGNIDKVRADERYRDEKYDPVLLSSRSAKQWPVYFGTSGDGVLAKSEFYGLPDEIINLIDQIWSCDNVLIDGNPFGMADGSKLEYTTADGDGNYAKRGLKVTVESGLNRNSQIFTVDVDPTKKLVTSVIVEAKVFGDLSNQGSANVVPVYNISNE